MTRIMLLTGLLGLLLALPQGYAPAFAQDDKELRAQRSEAHKARSEERKQRNQDLSDATRELRDYARELEAAYRPEAQELDTAFRLDEVRLRAEGAERVARAETGFQKDYTAALLGQGGELDAQRLQAMETNARAYGERLFALKRQAAEEVHRARMQAEADKDRLRDSLDQKVLARAAELGLTRDYAPIVARPIGGELTRQEEQWNQREEKEVANIAERNARQLAAYRNGQRLREWERANVEEDFRLQWEEAAERQALTAQHSVYGMLLQPAQGEAAGQAFMERAAELAEQERLIQIRYQQIKQENAIKRREEKKRILDA
ncbi:MAG: hypothetical protein ACNA7T_11865 [Haliea sp.]